MKVLLNFLVPFLVVLKEKHYSKYFYSSIPINSRQILQFLPLIFLKVSPIAFSLSRTPCLHKHLFTPAVGVFLPVKSPLLILEIPAHAQRSQSYANDGAPGVDCQQNVAAVRVWGTGWPQRRWCFAACWCETHQVLVKRVAVELYYSHLDLRRSSLT